MGSSFVDFRGNGFWARDASLEVWLYLLVREIDKLELVPDWLNEARDHWNVQATVGFVGCIDPQLGKRFLGQDRINLVIMLSERALRWLHEDGEHLSQDYLNSLGVGGAGSWWAGDVEVEKFARVGRKFIELLRGELKTDAATSPVF